MTKQKAIMLTAIFSLLFAAVLYQIASNSQTAQTVILLMLAVPGYLNLAQVFYYWLRQIEADTTEAREFYDIEK